MVMPHELHVYETGDDDQRPCSQEGKELQKAPLRDVHQRDPSGAVATSATGRRPRASAAPLTVTMAFGSAGSKARASALVSTVSSDVSRSSSLCKALWRCSVSLSWFWRRVV